jgi:hypothetical protein
MSFSAFVGVCKKFFFNSLSWIAKVARHGIAGDVQQRRQQRVRQRMERRQEAPSHEEPPLEAPGRQPACACCPT